MSVLVDPEDQRQVDAYLALEWLASEPYTRFVYGDPDLARAAHRYLFSQGMCEFAAPFARVVVSAGSVVAAAAWLSAPELRERRLQAALGLVRGGFFRDHPDLRPRMQLAATTLLEPEAHDLYLSRLAVDPAARGRGLGAELLSEYESEGRRRTCERLVLEVSPTSEAAAALYASAGFEEADTRPVSDPESRRELCYRHLVKPL